MDVSTVSATLLSNIFDSKPERDESGESNSNQYEALPGTDQAD